jgi:carboxymethylenebutenolidase
LAAASCATVPSQQTSAAERSVSIATADGSADAMLFAPAGAGPWPAVVLWPDLSGLRPAFAEIGRKLAGEGFVVLAPNSFYRSVKLDGSAATAQSAAEFGEVMRRGAPWRASASDPAIIADTKAYVAFLDAFPQVDKAAKIGVLGYDIGGAHAFIAARALPDRIGAVVAIHPLAIATARDTSPHLVVGQSKAAYLVEIAQPDDDREPGDKDDLRKAFADAGLLATIEAVPAGHGFGVSDQPGYDAATEARVWGHVVELLHANAD